MNNLIKTAGRGGNAGSLFFNANGYVLLSSEVPITSISAFVNFNSVTGLANSYFFGTLGLTRGVRYDGTTFLVRGIGISSTVNWTKQNKHVHFMLIRIDNDYDIYIDGFKIGTCVGGGGLNVQVIGARNLDLNFRGWMSNVRMFNRGLNINEIKLLSQGLHISRTGLMGEWKMNEMSGTTAYDTSGNGNHGTIVGATYSTDKPF